jgi:hypothetical protein
MTPRCKQYCGRDEAILVRGTDTHGHWDLQAAATPGVPQVMMHLPYTPDRIPY